MTESIEKKTIPAKRRRKPAPRKKPEKPVKTRTFHRLTNSEKLQAHGLSMELLAQMQMPYTVKLALRKRYDISLSQATRIVNLAQECVTDSIALDVPKERSKHVRQLEALYRRALGAGRLSVCANVLAQLGKVRGVEAATQVDINHKVEEFGAGRSDEELEHYAMHACWPEEMPAKARAETTEGDPLASLH